MSKFVIINLVLFQLAWFSCALLTDYASWILLGLIGCHFYCSKTKLPDAKLLTLAALGISIDIALFSTGVLTFAVEAFPIWLGLLWCMFVLTLNSSMAWLKNFNLLWVALIGSVSGPLSYYSAMKLGAIGTNATTSSFILTYAVCWTLLLPLLIFLSKKPYYSLSKI